MGQRWLDCLGIFSPMQKWWSLRRINEFSDSKWSLREHHDRLSFVKQPSKKSRSAKKFALNRLEKQSGWSSSRAAANHVWEFSLFTLSNTAHTCVQFIPLKSIIRESLGALTTLFFLPRCRSGLLLILFLSRQRSMTTMLLTEQVFSMCHLTRSYSGFSFKLKLHKDRESDGKRWTIP